MSDNPSVEEIAGKLTKAQREALVPFLTFSDRVGREMRRLGLLQCNDHVWTHTELGWAVRRHLQSTNKQEGSEL